MKRKRIPIDKPKEVFPRQESHGRPSPTFAPEPIRLFLDDVRSPAECATYMHQRIGQLNHLYMQKWMIVRNYDQFVEAVKKYYREIAYVSFDHDLADIHYNLETWTEGFKYTEKTGYDCAKWLKEFYQQRQLKLPTIFVHSYNPVGTANIINLFKSGNRERQD